MRGDPRHFPKILRRVSGYNLDELVPGLARPGAGVGGRALGVQPGPADRGVGGDPGGDRRGRGQGRADPPGAGIGDPLVRHDPRGARPAGRDHRHRAGGGGDGRPDDARPRREEPGLCPEPELRRGPPEPPSSPPSSTPTRRGAGRTRRRPGPPVRRRARRAGRPPEPHRVGQGRLLEDPQGRRLAADGHGRRPQAGRVRRGHRRRPGGPARLLRPVRRDPRPARHPRRLLRPRRRRLPAHPAGDQRQDDRGGRDQLRAISARSPTSSSSSAGR